jgi:hypothetical protein
MEPERQIMKTSRYMRQIHATLLMSDLSSPQANVCIMKGFCYADGEVNKKNTKEICDVVTSTVRWSPNDEDETC